MLELIMKNMALSSRSITNEAGKKCRQPIYKASWKTNRTHEFENKNISNHFLKQFQILEEFLSYLKVSKSIFEKRERDAFQFNFYVCNIIRLVLFLIKKKVER